MGAVTPSSHLFLSLLVSTCLYLSHFFSYNFLWCFSRNLLRCRHFENSSLLWLMKMVLSGGFGGGPLCCSSIRLFSVRHTSHMGVPAVSLWHLLMICHFICGSSVGFSFFSSQYLLESIVPVFVSVFRSCLWLLNL